MLSSGFTPKKDSLIKASDDDIKKGLAGCKITDEQDKVIQWTRRIVTCIQELYDKNTDKAGQIFNDLIDAINQSETEREFVISLNKELESQLNKKLESQ